MKLEFPDGNYLSEAERIKGKFMARQWEGRYIILRGTGKYEGILLEKV